MAQGFDCATKLNAASAKGLRAEGFEFVARYLGNSWKTFDAAEAKAIQDAGLKLVSIFEKSPLSVGYFTKSQGVADASEAESHAKAVGQPAGTAIYFTVDYDAQPAHMSAILSYLDSVRDTLKDYKIGLYGSYAVMLAVKGKVDYYWQTYAWSKKQVADFIHMHQYENGVTVSGVQVDRNDIKKDPGAWGTVTPQPAPTPAPTPAPNKDAYLHIVASGDTLSRIAAKYGVTVDYLVRLNGITNANLIYPGQRIKLQGTAPSKPAAPQPGYYVVRSGDNLTKIAKAQGTTVNQLVSWNGIKNPNLIKVGQKLRVR
jgi:LysM repeat protein